MWGLPTQSQLPVCQQPVAPSHPALTGCPPLLAAGATDAARGAADIVLTQPGLSAIITAIIGARKVC